MEKYTGEWSISTGMRHGKGNLVIIDGSIYEGYWINDKKNGFGRFIHVDGDIYDGYWANDKANGRGIYKHVNGA